jgi:transcriptional regulator with XRE-family HTH domain
MRINGNLSTSELARAVKLPQPTIHHILSGSTKNPRKKALEALSDYFSISVQQLIGEAELPSVIPETIKEDLHLKTVPVIDWHVLKQWPQLGNEKRANAKEVLLDKNVSPNSFAIVMTDSNMEPFFPKDSLLIFDHEKQPKDRDFVIVCESQSDDILFNRFFIDENESYLRQELDDGNVRLIKLNQAKDKILGTLTEVRIQY